MHRTLGDGYITDAGKRLFADEDLGSGRDATQLRHEEANAWQEEISSVIEAEGYTLNSPTELVSQMNQLNTAINKKVDDRVDAHLHTGVAGQPAKVLLTSAAEVQGLLPIANVTEHIWTASATFNFASDTTDPESASYRSYILQKIKTGSTGLMYVSFYLYWDPTTPPSRKWLRIELPSIFRPAGVEWYDFPISPVAAIREDGGVYTDIAGIYAKLFYDAGAAKNYLYLGNNELANQVPTTISFLAAHGVYNLSGNIIARCIV